MKKEVWFEFRSKGVLYKRNALQVLYAQAQHQQCLLIFKDGEVLTYPYPLCDFEKLVAGYGYERVHHSYLVWHDAIVDTRWNTAILSNGHKIPLNPKIYKELKEQIATKLRSFGFLLFKISVFNFSLN